MLDIAVRKLKYAVFEFFGLDVFEVRDDFAVLVFEFDAGEDSCALVVDFEAAEISIHIENFALGQGDFDSACGVAFGHFDFSEVAATDYSAVVLDDELSAGAWDGEVDAGKFLAVGESYD